MLTLLYLQLPVCPQQAEKGWPGLAAPFPTANSISAEFKQNCQIPTLSSFVNQINICAFVSSVSLHPFLLKFLRIIQAASWSLRGGRRSLHEAASSFARALPSDPTKHVFSLPNSPPALPRYLFGLRVSIPAPTAPSQGCVFLGRRWVLAGCERLLCSRRDPPAAPSLLRGDCGEAAKQR